MLDSDLRRRALARASAMPPQASELQRVNHELHVHQIELEMQNDELVSALEALERNRARFVDLYDQAPVGYCTLSEHGNLLETNRMARTLLGLPPSGPRPLLFSQLVAREDQDQLYLFRKHLMEQGQAQECEVRIPQPDGSIRWARLTGTRGDNSAEVRLILADVSDRRQSDEALKAESQRRELTLQCITDGVITTDAAGTIVSMNPAAEAMSRGLAPTNWGLPLAKVFPELAGLVSSVLTQRQALEWDRVMLTAGPPESTRYLFTSGSPILGPNASCLGVVLVLRDQTMHLKMTETLQRTDKLESLGVLAGGIAHDFNNLLGGIFGYITLARGFSEEDSKATLYLDRAQKVFRRATALTQQLMTFAKGATPQKRCGILSPLIRDATSFALSGSSVNCEFDLADDLSLCDFDENQISQVIDNLVINARQAMPRGGTIQIRAKNVKVPNESSIALAPGNYVRVTIADHGDGIPQANLANIFDPFFTTKQTGHGLGLATCQTILQKHDGLIEVESKPGEGARFHFYLPATKGVACHDKFEGAIEHVGSGKILILDDEDFLREILSEMLSCMGYSVLEAASGKDALRIVGQGPELRAAILDLTVRGGIGGLEVMEHLKAQLPKVPVFAISGLYEDPVLSKPQSFGFTDSLRKPFLARDLAGLLERHLGKR